MEKILITGTGRCGTTFLIKLFSFLGFDTGYNEENYNEYIYPNCNSGMERPYESNFYILKNPTFMADIKTILEDTTIKIKTIIVPIRDFEKSAESRNKHTYDAGGLWNAVDKISQIKYYKDIFINFIYFTTKYDVNTIYLDFDKMINDKTYLFNKLINILNEKNIDFEKFCKIYDDVSLTAKPTQ